MHINRNITGSIALAFSLLALGGCSQQTVNSANEDAKKNIAKLDQAAKEVEVKAKPELKKLGLGARVTAAIQANANLPKTIRVDANETGVQLRGTVKTESQKALASRVAKDTLPADKSVTNELQVKNG